MARLPLLAVAAVSLRRARRAPHDAAVLAGGAALGTALLLTSALSGHAVSGRLTGAAVVADVVHLAGISVWLGGLTVLVVALLRTGDATVADPVVARFSKVALTAVAVIAVSGTFQSWRQVGSLEALTGTTYGRLLLIKLALFAVLIGLASWSRQWVRQRSAGRRPVVAVSPGPGAVARSAPGTTIAGLRRTVAVEVGVAIAVLAVTALLVNAPPARGAVERPYSVQEQAGDVTLGITVDPTRAGPVDVHI